MPAERIKRVFELNTGNKTTRLDDPNPDFTTEEVKKFFLATYPSMTNSSVSGPELEEKDEETIAVYTISSVIGDRG